jgi:hypothetical protein
MNVKIKYANQKALLGVCVAFLPLDAPAMLREFISKRGVLPIAELVFPLFFVVLDYWPPVL